VTNQQKSVTAQVIAAEELLLKELILLQREWAWQPSGKTRNVLEADQMSEFRKLCRPSQFVEDAAQMEEQVDTAFLERSYAFLRDRGDYHAADFDR
jgi:hypothetical protein